MSRSTTNTPMVFISHAATDGAFANAVKLELEAVFSDAVEIFCTSSPGALPPGIDWLHEIEKALHQASALVVIVTPISIQRPWLWFEVGASWAKARARDCAIIPLCAAEIDLATLPAPLNSLQALSMGQRADLVALFRKLCEDFAVGDLSRLQIERLIAKLPKYATLTVSDADRREQGVHSSRYVGYSDHDLMEILDTQLFSPDELEWSKFRVFAAPREELIGRGKLLDYRQIDQSLDLPPGTAKRLLKVVADRFWLIPTFETENVVRFDKTSHAPRKGDPFAR